MSTRVLTLAGEILALFFDWRGPLNDTATPRSAASVSRPNFGAPRVCMPPACRLRYLHKIAILCGQASTPSDAVGHDPVTTIRRSVLAPRHSHDGYFGLVASAEVTRTLLSSWRMSASKNSFCWTRTDSLTNLNRLMGGTWWYVPKPTVTGVCKQALSGFSATRIILKFCLTPFFVACMVE